MSIETIKIPELKIDASVLKGALSGVPAMASQFKTTVDAVLKADDFTVLDLGQYCDSYEGFKSACTALASALGTLMVQNEDGATVVEVYDRNVGRIEEGVRYHQTRQGGDIHTDSVNRPDPMKYLILGSAATSVIGGESILIRAREVIARLQGMPEVLDILRQPFWFEGRGMSAEQELFQQPVLRGPDEAPDFRYLRPYIASAHERAGTPLTTDQTYAFDVLDSVAELSDMQHRFMLEQGQMLLAVDTRVFHGRTSFVDGVTPGAWVKGRRMLRYWVE
ncbi:Taurine catabolism dioxygenase TauD, TfdA family [Shimia gijangensis]|uniref:Taurine catabolism dioxygenase TauD, TfdA family n=1 Tax=Shimia gijangensis TaxID=1470563 RepID=A0A1M6M5Q0_9RHOB|nr:TauD/TfdA family dioxygenase [Shimia gijangensis]SHJ78806.1 Taurine catabolism dioxygenase TauD, TfdA family [Shimia gijangensis]